MPLTESEFQIVEKSRNRVTRGNSSAFKQLGLLDQRLERGCDISVPGGLTAGESAGIAAQIGQVLGYGMSFGHQSSPDSGSEWLAKQLAISKKVPSERNRMMPATLLVFVGYPQTLRDNEALPGREGMMNKRKAPRPQSHMDVELATKSTAKLGPDIKAKIGQQLRAMYSDVVNQGVPDRFSEILRRLDQAGVEEAGADRKTENEGSNGPTK